MREQNALGDEIAQSMNSVNIGNEIDDAELDAELDDLQQEQVDGQMPKMSHTTIPNTLEGGQTAGSEKRTILSSILHLLKIYANLTIIVPDVPTMTEDEEVEAELRQLEMA